jgi:hypothetical protein
MEPQMTATACICCVLSAVLLAAAPDPIRLPMGEDAWDVRLFPAEGVAPLDAASLSVETDPGRGPCLAVGPWRDGQWRAALQSRSRLEQTSGIVRGWYRSEGLQHGEAAVFAEFYIGDRRIRMDSFGLGPAAGWTELAVTIRQAPPGTESLSLGFGLRSHTEGNVRFAQLALDPQVPTVEFPDELPPVTRPAPPASFDATGRYRLAEANGAWWLVAPDGSPFYATGTDGRGFDREEPGLATGRAYYEAMRRIGFTSLGGWTNIWRWRVLNDALVAEGAQPPATFTSLQTGNPRDRYDALIDASGRSAGEPHAFPDPFDPRFEATYREWVRERASMIRDKVWFAGWFADNEASHNGLYRHVYSPNCARAFAAWLRDRYGDVARLNAAWGTDYASLGALIEARPDPALPGRIPATPGQSPVVPEGAMYEDFLAFEQVVVKRYIDITIRSIRAEDPDSLIFSNRFMLGDQGAWARVHDLYGAYDGIAINIYPRNRSAGLSEDEKDVLRAVHEQTGKPIIIGEWSVPAVDSGLYDNPDMIDWSWPQTVPTQEERARQAALVTIDFYNLPFIVGAHWFTWRDFDNERRRANRGLFRADGRPWERLQEKLAEADAKIAEAAGM